MYNLAAIKIGKSLLSVSMKRLLYNSKRKKIIMIGLWLFPIHERLAQFWSRERQWLLLAHRDHMREFSRVFFALGSIYRQQMCKLC